MIDILNLMFKILKKHPKKSIPNSYEVCQYCNTTIDYYNNGNVLYTLTCKNCSKETEFIKCIGFDNKGCSKYAWKNDPVSLCNPCKLHLTKIEEERQNKLFKEETERIRQKVEKEVMGAERMKKIAERDAKEFELMAKTDHNNVSFTKLINSKQVVIFVNGEPIGRYNYGGDMETKDIPWKIWNRDINDLLLGLVYKQSQQIRNLEVKFDKLIDMIEFSPDGPQCQEASKRFEKNIKKI